MKKTFIIQPLFFVTLCSALGSVSSAFASGFQLWEQDGASIGNYHAGRAAIAEDASTAFYNPAGLVRIPNQQMVLAADPIVTDFLFDGTIAVNNLLPPTPQNTNGQGGTFNLVPSFNYAAPLNNNFVFGFSIVAPFGLKTDYGNSTLVRYSATLTSLKVIDFSPSLGFALDNKISIGAGLDIEHADAQFDVDTALFDSETATSSTNKGSSNALGYHIGLLFQYSEATRIGLNYQSRVILHTRHGDSDYIGPLANDLEGGTQSSNNLETDITLPAVTSLSFFHTFNNVWDVMATVSYTQWSILDNIILKNVAGISEDFEPSNDITVIIPQNYHNTWNYSFGANYHVNDTWFIRSGIGYDETPTNNKDRNLQLPDGDRVVLALGVHYQPIKTLAFDASWSHFFVQSVDIDVSQTLGAQVTTTNGNVTGNADVYGFQMTWNIL